MEAYKTWAIVTGTIVGGAVLFFLFHTYGPQVTDAIQTATLTFGPPTGVVTEHRADIPEGYKEYRNDPYKFKLFFPSDLSWKEYHEKQGALTVTFRKNDGTNGGFQVFIVPYNDSQISPQRFRLDEPSGIRNQETAIVLDNSPATMFFSTNAVMGDSREVWFIKNGFLYEVTTYKELDSWLAEIMTTWKFL